MPTNRTRYSFLSPMSISDSVSVFFAALDFFQSLDRTRLGKL